MNLNTCHVGDCRELLKQMAAAGVRVQTCVTSPPYFGLRDYGMPLGMLQQSFARVSTPSKADSARNDETARGAFARSIR